MLRVPEGCRESVQISFIENTNLRPSPDFCWLIDIVKKNGDTVTTCRSTLENAIDFAKKELG
jgi:hypothetical protein